MTEDPATSTSPYEPALTKLADDIGLNRVIAGLHYKSDIAAGADVAGKIHHFLRNMPSSSTPPVPPNFSYASAIAAARQEWL